MSHPGAEKVYWALKTLRGLAPAVMTGVVGVGFTLWTTAGFDRMLTFPTMWWAIGSAVLGIVVIVGHFTFFKPTYQELARDEAKARADATSARGSLQHSMDTLLWVLLRSMDGQNHTTRISAYSVEDDEFVLVSRRSHNPKYERRGRPAYPLWQGTIGQAWTAGSSITSAEPVSRAAWEAELIDSAGYSSDEAVGLSMMALSIRGMRLDTASGEKLGILVLESTEPQKFDSGTLTKLRRSPVRRAILDILERSHAQFPRVLDRTQERSQAKKVVTTLVEPAWKERSHSAD